MTTETFYERVRKIDKLHPELLARYVPQVGEVVELNKAPALCVSSPFSEVEDPVVFLSVGNKELRFIVVKKGTEEYLGLCYKFQMDLISSYDIDNDHLFHKTLKNNPFLEKIRKEYIEKTQQGGD